MMPSDAQDAIGSIPRRPRDAMKLSQKTCLRSEYRFFGLKSDMFLVRARLRGFPRAGGVCDAAAFAGYIGLGRYIPFFCLIRENPSFPIDRRRIRRMRRRRLVPGGSAMWFPAADGECRPRWPQAAAPSPLDALSVSPGTRV